MGSTELEVIVLLFSEGSGDAAALKGIAVIVAVVLSVGSTDSEMIVALSFSAGSSNTEVLEGVVLIGTGASSGGSADAEVWKDIKAIAALFSLSVGATDADVLKGIKVVVDVLFSVDTNDAEVLKGTDRNRPVTSQPRMSSHSPVDSCSWEDRRMDIRMMKHNPLRKNWNIRFMAAYPYDGVRCYGENLVCVV